MAATDLIGTPAYAKAIASLPERFSAKLEPAPGGCVEWTGTRNAQGYGTIDVAGRMVRATHAAIFLATGSWPPDGLLALHRCDNPACVNHAHLFLGTHRDNAEDRDNKGRGVILRNPEWCSQKGEANPSAKLTPAQIDAIRSSDEGRAILADRYGVRPETIWRIRTGRLWAERQSPCTV